MKPAFRCILALVASSCAALVPVVAADLPLVNGKPVVASVNNDPVSLEELEQEIGMAHMSRGDGDMAKHRQNPGLLLDRIITARLFVQEARNIGLDEQPEMKAELERTRNETLRDVLTARALKDVSTPDPAVVKRSYEDLVREVRVRSFLFSQEADAKDVVAKVKAGGDLDALARKLVQAKRAEEGRSTEWLKAPDLAPDVNAVLRKLKVGELSPVLQVGKSFTLFKLLDVRYPESAERRAQASEAALAERRGQELQKYVEGLRKKYTRVDEKLLASLDFDKPGNYEKFAKDKRALVQITGDQPVTVADYAAGVQQRFFHGVDKAVEAKRINKERERILEDVVNRRVVISEARRQGIDKTDEYRRNVTRRTGGLLFGAFVEKAIQPEVKLSDGDLKAYMAAHSADFTGPEMMVLEALVFTERRDAEDALGKLQRGAEFSWLKGNARGQVDPSKGPTLEFAAGPMITGSLPPGLQKALTGARDGDYRFYAEATGNYVVHVKKMIPSQVLPLESVAEKVQKLVYQEKIRKAIDDWGAKLRKASNVKVYATGEDLMKLIMRDMSTKS